MSTRDVACAQLQGEVLMLLDRLQFQRYLGTFEALVGFAAEKTGKLDLLYPRDTLEPDRDIECDMVEWLWDGHREVIAEFVRANPAHLPESEVQEVRRWESALFGTFALCVDQAGRSVFLGSRHSFLVTGLNCEPSRLVSKVPALVSVALLTYAGKIVHTPVMREFSADLGANMVQALRDDMAAHQRDGRVAATASEYLAVASKLGVRLQLEGRILEEQAPAQEYLDGISGMPRGQHLGDLAGLAGTERSLAQHRRRCEDVPGGHSVRGYSDDARRVTLVQPTEYAEEVLRMRGVARTADVARECIAYLRRNGYKVAGGLQPSKVSNELVRKWRDDPDTCVYEVLDTPDGSYLLEYTLAKDNWYELTGSWHPEASDREDGYPGRELGQGVLRLLQQQRKYPVRQVPDELFQHITSYHGWIVDQPGMRELMHYLDAHVPDGENDFTYADRVLDSVLECLRNGYSLAQIMRELSDMRVYVDERSYAAVSWLVRRAIDGLPSWECNGWSPAEARRLLAAG